MFNNNKYFLWITALFLMSFTCNNIQKDKLTVKEQNTYNAQVQYFKKILPGANQTNDYLSLLRGKRVAVVGNQTSCIGKVHLVDSLLSQGIKLVKVFAPEHGFRGKASAGEQVQNSVDVKTGLPIFPYTEAQETYTGGFKTWDVLLFDIQRCGVLRFLYLSFPFTLYLWERPCRNKNIPVNSFGIAEIRTGIYSDGPG